MCGQWPRYELGKVMVWALPVALSCLEVVQKALEMQAITNGRVVGTTEKPHQLPLN